MSEIAIALIFFGIAFLYSSVGFGGGSSYLALLALISVGLNEIRTTALILNISVVMIGSVRFYRMGLLSFRSFAPFILASMLTAFFGAQIHLQTETFFILLGCLLVLAALFMLIQSWNLKPELKTLNTVEKSTIGGVIGFISGLVGIGGGIFLSPALHLINWRKPHAIAALSTFFILCNSIAGLIGLAFSSQLVMNFSLLQTALPAVVIGGLLGNYVLSTKLNRTAIRILTALFVSYVGLKLVLANAFEIHI